MAKKKSIEYKKEILEILDNKIIKSVNEICAELKIKFKRNVMNWHIVYRHLRDLREKGKLESLEAKGGLYWRKK